MDVRRVLAVLLVLLTTAGAAIGALAVFSVDRDLPVGTVRLSADPGHKGALDLYVPLVDWGVRFNAVRLPARLSIDLRSLDRAVIGRVARGSIPQVDELRADAEDAIESYIRLLVLIAGGAALALGVLMALALRGRAASLRFTVPTAVLGSLLCCAAIALLLPPRGPIENPEYYANGPEIPPALQAIDQANTSADTISEELNDQLVGLARLVAVPAGRTPAAGLPRLTLASDLHNNLLALPTLERAARGGPLLFAGDLTSSGSPFEARLTTRLARIGDPFVFVSGNHDSEELERGLARAGAVVLTERGRMLPGGGFGEVVVGVGGLRVAGYSDPFERLRTDGYRAREVQDPSEAQQRRFADWLEPLLGSVDVVIVHSPSLAEEAVDRLREDPPVRPVAVLTGHTHVPALRMSENLVELNGGTVGGGGTGNLEKNQPFGLAVLTYADSPRFDPVLADTVEIDAVSGAAQAARSRLDLGPGG
ncbi:MAG: metallophosphoesterase [Actinomycetota bacterium]|nr:metallophosphoesterase [Actinomycetota bacterium]